MYLLYEEDGQFKVGTILSEADASLQIEAQHGKRAKIKADRVMLRFAAPEPAQFLEAAHRLRDDADTDFLWEVAGSEEFDYLSLAQDYFGHTPTPVEAAGILMCLHDSPIHFHKRGRGRYRPAPPDILAAARAGQEKKRLAAEKQARLVEALCRYELPSELPPLLPRLALKPDKNLLEWKALEEAAAKTGLSVARLLERCGAIPDVEAFHLAAFTLEHFPKGTDFPAVAEPYDPPELPLAEVTAFSMDDAATTEIDDAFSVAFREDGSVRVGIHIACPALGLPPGSALDEIARARLSTVYFPGRKFTMLPEAFIRHYTLGESHACPALSLYLTVAPDFTVQAQETKLEQVAIAANLRHETLDASFNEDSIGDSAAPDYPYRRELEWLWGFAATLEAARGAVNQNNRQDYNFKFVDGRIVIEPRRRGSPIDKVVSELMIRCNSYWGTWLADNKVAALYRNQSMGKTRMATQPGPHQGLGVENYAWSSSPLRRYVDLVNQRQLIALARAETPPYAPRSEFLFAAVRDFELAYDAYNEFQRKMERYWVLRWFAQEAVTEITASVIREDLVRFEGVPFITRIGGLPALEPGQRIRLMLTRLDFLEVELAAEFAGLVEDVPPAPC